MMKIILFFVAIGALDFTASKEAQLEGVVGFAKPSRQGLAAPLVVGGTEAGRTTHQHLVSIQVRAGAGDMHLCGGSLIQLNKIVTAAHCVDNMDANNLVIVAGVHDLAANDGTGQRQTVLSITIHPSFNRDTFEFDYAVIRTTQPFTLTRSVFWIPMRVVELTVGDCVVTGWGNTRGDGGRTDPALLQQVNVPIVPRDQCSTRFAGIVAITERMICAGAPGRDSCNGDGGGPLVCGNQLAGIVSWGLLPCALGNFPGVYANIVAARDFINAQ